MAMAPEQAGIGIRRYFTTEGTHPFDEVDWERRDARITQLPRRLGRLRAARGRVPRRLVAQRHQHRRPEVLPRHPRHARARVARYARSIDRVVDTITDVGRRRTATSSTTREADDLQRRAQAPDRHPEGRLQLAGVVQHRGARACPSRPRPASSSPSTTRWTPSSTGTSRRARSSRAARARASTSARSARSVELLKGGGTASGPVSFMRGADASAGTIKSRRQDPPRRQDGHPQRRPPRHRGVHLVQGHRGEEGPGPRGGRLRHEPRRQGHHLHPVPERQQLGAGHRRVHAGRGRRRRLEPAGRHHR